MLEYKKAKDASASMLRASVKEALGQIMEKRYFTELEAEGIPKGRIRIYGLAFAGKDVAVGGGYLQEVCCV